MPMIFLRVCVCCAVVIILMRYAQIFYTICGEQQTVDENSKRKGGRYEIQLKIWFLFVLQRELNDGFFMYDFSTKKK